MTTIAWDGKTLAADRQSTWGNTPLELPSNTFKIARKGDYLLGAAGYTAEAQHILAEYPVTWQDVLQLGWLYDENSLAILVHATGVYVKRKQGLACVGFVNLQWAVGSGCDYALGAMRAGADARRAVEIASELDVNTGQGVDVLTFGGEGKP